MKDDAKAVIEQLLGNKKLTLRRGNSDEFGYDKIPFGIPALDKLTGGGIAKKRITLLYGPPNVGKSFLASQIAVNAQHNNDLVGWVDTEQSWDSKWMEKCGLNTEEVLVCQPTTGEEAFETVREMMSNGVALVVLDSMAGLVPSAVYEEEFGYNPIAWQARFVNSSFPKLLPHLKQGSALVLINQIRSSMGPVSIDAMPGGLAQTFFAHSLLQVKRDGWIEEPKGVKVGFDMDIRMRKTKIGGEHWNHVKIPFRIEGGIDIMETFIREALTQNLIQQRGAWYMYGEEKMQGMNGLKHFFLENPSRFEELKISVT
jgi:recombination protein RecA|tara:strand:- start:221 stop:1162 length:942 start_codon:yes stop_codon:yes gene_type:complete